MKKITVIAVLTALLTATAVQAGTLDEEILSLQKEWAIINYKSVEDERESAFAELAARARVVAERFPDRAEPLVWEGIILSTYAGSKGGLGALGLIDDARNRLLEAEEIDPAALDGSIYTSLGSLYYQAPGWPISFGSDKKADAYLSRALEINPDGIDPNYFYGDYLIEQGDYKNAIEVLHHALKAPSRPARSLADLGRRNEIYAKIAIAEEKIKNSHSEEEALW